MSRRYAGSHTLPENPTWVEFPRSDGDPSVLPKNTKQVVDSEGQVNFMRPVPLDESLAVGWRVAVGAQLAIRMGLPEGPKYVLKSFPEGYQLYDHNKGPVKNPRHDPYLCGSIHVNRFRSTNEFIPHALWLMQDPTMNRANCSCKYCTKQPQRIISDNLGLSGISARRSASVSAALPPSLRVARPRREPREPRQPRVPPKPFAAVRRAPTSSRIPVDPEQYILPERDLDIRASLSSAEGHRPRWFRKGEAVWCLLEPPIRGLQQEEDIQFWPGLVEDMHIKTQAILEPTTTDAQQHIEADMECLYQEAAEGSPGLEESSSNSSTAGLSKAAEQPLEAQGKVPWRVHQWYVYKVKLLGTAQHAFVSDEQVLPYLAYAPSDHILDRIRHELSEFLQTVPIDQMDRDLDLMSTFDPLEPEPQGDGPEDFYKKYKSAAAPYTLAIQIAANIAQYWLPTDEWTCKYVIPPATAASSAPPPEPPTSQTATPSSSQPPQPQSQPEVMTLHSLITQSLTQNAGPPTAHSTNGSAVSHSESISTYGRLPRSSTVAHTVKQLRFQGLWWGTERIWTDEVVRLKIARCQFAPKGTDKIYPPAGPSPSTLESMRASPEASQADPQRLGASEKGLFMRLEGLFLVDVPSSDGVGFTKECRASGMVYELVEDDWEEVVDSNKVADVHGTASKGKEKAGDVSNGHGPGTSSEAPPQDANGVPTLMSQQSPPKPAPLLNPDPSVPMSEAASSILARTTPATAATNEKDQTKRRSLSMQLSHPVLSMPYPLPPATKGFRFRPILPPDHEAVISLSLISGRYYPGLFHHPLMAPTVARALSLSTDDGGLYQNRHIWAMEGLLPGIHQSMEPRQWRKSRMVILQEADREARERFRERWEETKMARLHPPEPEQEEMQGQESQWEHGNDDAAMDVDSDSGIVREQKPPEHVALTSPWHSERRETVDVSLG
ncbi:hypothetical protein BD414DRAFT_477969 [Trametes punicea]|nr:hypothetical protein BD414DRAFT_477969 [Trametes punicea]